MKSLMRLTLFAFGWMLLVSAASADLLVCSVNGDRILRFDETTGAYRGDFVSARTGGLDEPQGMEYGPDSNLYVCSNDQHAVLRFDGVTGAFIDAFVPPRSGGLNAPADLEFGPDGNLYVTSYVNGSVANRLMARELARVISVELTGSPRSGKKQITPQRQISPAGPCEQRSHVVFRDNDFWGKRQQTEAHADVPASHSALSVHHIVAQGYQAVANGTGRQ